MVFLQEFLVHPGFVIKPFEIGLARQLDEVMVALEIGGQEDQMIVVVVGQQAFALSPAAGCEIGFAPDDGLHPVGGGFFVEINGAEEVAVIRDGERGLVKVPDLPEKRIQLIRAVQQAVLGVEVQVNELRRHGPPPLRLFPQAQFVEQSFPALLFRNEPFGLDNGQHAGARDPAGLPHATVFQDPHQFAGRS